MTPIRSINARKLTDPPEADQTSNGVYSVRPHLVACSLIPALEVRYSFRAKLNLILKAEV